MTDPSDGAPEVIDLVWYVNAIGEDVNYARSTEAEARQLVEDFIGKDNPYKVPESIVERAVLEVGADLYYRKASRNGVVQMEGVEPQLFRLNRDPMAAAYPLLRRYLVMGL
ncbi:hypothetical protein [uncultured Leifsonia sp.]|uniref:hypothetical protein n=1 Tax=uncultured Leifsonia sp. TaxID=340359 RepID=UPI0028D60942|nr:hypothetical protein [uncultured Leifsonia sp.]